MRDRFEYSLKPWKNDFGKFVGKAYGAFYTTGSIPQDKDYTLKSWEGLNFLPRDLTLDDFLFQIWNSMTWIKSQRHDGVNSVSDEKTVLL